MRRSKSAVFSALSVLAILAGATAAQASAALEERFGLLQSQGQWRVGTVDVPEGAPYCAMVNQFDKGAVLAISRNADGLGSIAMDFHKSFFRPGMEYEITLRVDDAKIRKFSGRASSDHSIVVQLGHDKNFYASLNEDGNLRVEMSALNATFSLRRFSASYVALLNCAGGLHQGPKTAAVPVPGVEKAPLPLALNDRQAQEKLRKDKEQQAEKMSAKESELALRVAELQKDRDTLKSQMNELKDSHDGDDDSEPVQENLTVKEIQLERQKQAVAELERKYSEQQEAQEDLKRAFDKKEKEVIRLREAQKAQEARRAEEISYKAQELALRVAELQKDRDVLKAQMEAVRQSVHDSDGDGPENKKINEPPAMKEKQAAEAVKQQAQNPVEMARALSVAQANYLEVVMAENVPLKASLDKTGKDLAESKARVAELEGQLTLTKTAAAGDSQKLDATQAELKKLMVERAAVVDQMQAALNNKIVQHEALKKQFEAQNATLPLTFKMAADLAAKKENEARLEKQLAEAEAARVVAAEAAVKAQKALAELAKQQAEKIVSVETERDALNENPVPRKEKADKKAAEQRRAAENPQARNRKLAAPEKAAAVIAEAAPPADIAPSAGEDEQLSEDPAPLPLSENSGSEGVASFLDKIMAYHRLSPAARSGHQKTWGPASATVIAGEHVTLEAVLGNSGIALDNFVPVDHTPDSVVSKWTSGKVSGMFEQVFVGDGFDDQVSSYIDRYRQDCSGTLDSRIAAPETSGIGAMVVADIACAMPSNSYASSFLFLQNGHGFSAILHTGYPAEKAEVRRIRDAIVRALLASDLSAPPRRFGRNALSAPEPAPGEAMDDPQTLVIQ